MSLRPHSDAWYERLASMQAGYFYPWSSTIAPGNGEDAYLDLVRRHLSPNLDVLDAGCGDGELTLGLAPLCRTIHGYDRVQRFIDIAVAASRERGVRSLACVYTAAGHWTYPSGSTSRATFTSSSASAKTPTRSPPWPEISGDLQRAFEFCFRAASFHTAWAASRLLQCTMGCLSSTRCRQEGGLYCLSAPQTKKTRCSCNIPSLRSL